MIPTLLADRTVLCRRFCSTPGSATPPHTADGSSRARCKLMRREGRQVSGNFHLVFAAIRSQPNRSQQPSLDIWRFCQATVRHVF